MKKLRAQFILFWLILGVFIYSVDASCVLDVKDEQKMSHFVVESCTNIGVFSVGTFVGDEWRSLTYRYPKPWKGTYITVWVDGDLYSNSIYSTGAKQMDVYVQQVPTEVRPGEVLTKWTLPAGVDVEQTIASVDGGVVVKVKVINREMRDISAGVRLSLDLMVDGNDGAPILVPNKGVLMKEFSYVGSEIDFDYLIAQDYLSNPNVVARIQSGVGSEKPSRVTFANWKTGRSPAAWEYAVDPQRSTEIDSAIMLYYGPKNIAAGGAAEFSVYFSSKAPETKPTCYDNSRNQDESDIDCGGSCKPCPEGGRCRKNIDCVTGLCQNGFCVKPTATTQAGRGFELPPVLLYILLLVAAVIVLAVLAMVVVKAKGVGVGAAAPKAAKGEIIVTKAREGNNITVTVNNASTEDVKDCVLVDGIPPGAEVKFIVGKNVSRRRKHLVWKIGDLKAGEKAVLEYSTNVDKKAKIENFSFLSQNPVMSRINEA